MDQRAGLDQRPAPYTPNTARLRAGHVGGQFWSVFVEAHLPGPEQVKGTLEQIDLVTAIVARYPREFALARTVADVRRIHAGGPVASLIGVEGRGWRDADVAKLAGGNTLRVMAAAEKVSASMASEPPVNMLPPVAQRP